MLRYRVLRALAVTGLFAMCSTGQAAVYDFGNLSIASHGLSAAPDSFVQRASVDKTSYMWAPGQNISSNSFTGESASTGFSYESGEINSSSGFKNGNLLASVAYNDMQRIDSGYSVSIPVKAPVSSTPETQRYAMLLAGFGLLCLSARRRKSDTFD